MLSTVLSNFRRIEKREFFNIESEFSPSQLRRAFARAFCIPRNHSDIFTRHVMSRNLQQPTILPTNRFLPFHVRSISACTCSSVFFSPLFSPLAGGRCILRSIKRARNAARRNSLCQDRMSGDEVSRQIPLPINGCGLRPLSIFMRFRGQWR